MYWAKCVQSCQTKTGAVAQACSKARCLVTCRCRRCLSVYSQQSCDCSVCRVVVILSASRALKAQGFIWSLAYVPCMLCCMQAELADPGSSRRMMPTLASTACQPTAFAQLTLCGHCLVWCLQAELVDPGKLKAREAKFGKVLIKTMSVCEVATAILHDCLSARRLSWRTQKS